jgi:hypothetical protein
MEYNLTGMLSMIEGRIIKWLDEAVIFDNRDITTHKEILKFVVDVSKEPYYPNKDDNYNIYFQRRFNRKYTISELVDYRKNGDMEYTEWINTIGYKYRGYFKDGSFIDIPKMIYDNWITVKEMI